MELFDVPNIKNRSQTGLKTTPLKETILGKEFIGNIKRNIEN